MFALKRPFLQGTLRTLPANLVVPFIRKMASENVVKDILDEINGKMEKAYERCPFATRKPRLVAVSKTKPVEALKEVYDQGHRHFGENYVQELLEKAPQLPEDIEWHFIGHLQSNKCNMLTELGNLAVVETVGSVKLATALDKACVKNNRSRPLDVMVQVNTSGEDSKHGAEPADAPAVAQHIVTNCPKLKLVGLMTIGQYGRDPALGPNPDFDLLRECRSKVAQALGVSDSDLELSMGMSGDYEQAIEQGSTNVRVGSTIFGERNYAKK
eukprot:Colp12_sorted_trinity150504_noHs@36230